MSTRSLGLVTFFLVLAWTGVVSAQYTTNPSPIVATDEVGGGGTGAMGMLSEPGNPTVDLQLDAACTGFTVTPNDNVTLPASITVTYTATARTPSNVNCTIHIKAQNGMGADLGTFVVQGKGIAAELSITTTPKPIDFGAPRAFDMAATPTSTKSIRVENTGDNLPLTVSAIDIGGTHAGDYTPTLPTLPLVLMQGQFADIDVVFNPGGAGTRTATFDVTSDDPVTPTENASLTGVGTSATIRANDLDFNTVAVGTTTISQIRIDNTAASNPGPLTITGAMITQSSTWFSFDGANGCTAGSTMCTLTGVVANNATTMPALVNLRCHPPAGAMGFQVATVSFTSDTDAGGTDNVAGITCTAGRADVTVDPASFAFGDQLVNGTSTAKVFTLNNPGSTTLTYSLAFNSGDTSQFQFSGSPCTSSCTLGAGADTTVSVVFAPTSTGSKATNLRITSNDPDNPTVDVALSGNGVAPHAMADKNTLAFGMVEVGDTSTAIELSVTNTGTAPLQINSAGVVVNAGDYTVPMGTLGAQTVGVGMTAKWMIACRPTTFGSRDGTFRIVSNSDGVANNPLNVALACSGQRGVLVADPTSLAFGTVPIGEMVERTFTLTNPGNQQVTNIDATFSNPNAGYSIVDPPALPISMIAGNNGTVTVRVRYAPVDTSTANVTLTLTGSWGTNKTATATVSLTGQGQSVAFAVAPGTVDFGSFRWDTSVTRTVCVQNNAAAAFDITGITLANVVMPGDITVVSIKRTSSSDCSVASANPNITTWPQTLTNGQRLEVIVRADPATDRTGALSATLQVTSSLMGTPMRMAALSGTATSPALTIDPANAVIDFGLVDRDQGAPQPRELLITNTGDGPMNLGTFVSDTAGTPFTISATASTLLLPGQSRTFTVTHDPATATESVDHVATITQPLTGILNGPTSTMVMIKARTIDRHIAIAAAPAFPMTFRNPGSLAPMAPVMVTNTGEATLKITAVMLMGGPVWEVVDGNPVDIPGGASHEFQVRFLPTEEGPAPQGQLALMNDDNDQPMAVLNLYGIGRLRDVVLGEQPVIDLGETAVGLPVTLPDGLPVINRDTENGFTIKRIELADGSALRVEDAPDGDVLDAAATLRYGLTFTPELEGEFETTATLYLDEDPVPTTTVTIRGRAVFVDLGGGGGCSTGGGTGGAMVLVLGALLLARRRRTGIPAALAVCVLVPAAARAQEARFDLDLSLFDPTPSTTGYRFQIEPATVGKNGDWVVAATASYAANPLVMRTTGSEHLTISQITSLELGAAYAFLDRFEAGLRMPLYSQDGDGSMLGVPSPSGTARGDLVAHVRAQLLKAALGEGSFAAGASAALTLPTATDAQFAGVDKPSGRVLGLVTLAPGVARKRLTFTGNLGAILRSKTQVANIEQGSGVAWGAGMSVRLLDKLWTTGEVYGDYLFSARKPAPMATAENMLTAEWLLGLSYRPDPRVAVGVALGRGLTTGLGAPELRGVFALTYAPGSEKLAPIYPPPPPKIDGDEDADGIKDSKDKCPEDAEDKDGFQDDDGCPDLDNDNDAYTDSNDKCPLEPEDVDGFQDDDGCPDLDNDNDGIPDAKDRCPNKSEDKDGFRDDDGCPEVDNDEDGIIDEEDKCPKEPETINGNADDDGCPDRGDALIIVTPSALDMLDTIQWNGARLAPASKNLLAQVGATLRAHPEILRLKIVSHVNPSGNDKRDRELTEKRAIAIREWLITWGIVPTRLSGQGMGGSKPLVPATQKGAAQLNDRIELIILEKK